MNRQVRRKLAMAVRIRTGGPPLLDPLRELTPRGPRGTGLARGRRGFRELRGRRVPPEVVGAPVRRDLHDP